MKEMQYLQYSMELVLDQLHEDGVRLFNVLLTCMEMGNERAVKEALRDSLAEVDFEAEYYVRIYYVDANRTPMRIQKRNELLKFMDIPQWAMERLPMKYGAFGLMLRPKETPNDPDKRRVWIFMRRDD